MNDNVVVGHSNDRADQVGRAKRALTVVAATTVLTITLSVFSPTMAGQQSTDLGKQLFEKRCTGCHALDRNKEGPGLAGVYGRRAGTAPGFNYSPALRSAGFTWDAQRLDQWLTDTQSVVEDNNMDFHVPKADERAEIIHYLEELSSMQKSASNSR